MENTNYSEKVVAFLRKDGVYNGNEYHNYVLAKTANIRIFAGDTKSKK